MLPSLVITSIWAVVLDKISKHPWLGYGYKGFWLGMEGNLLTSGMKLTSWHHAHNGFWLA